MKRKPLKLRRTPYSKVQGAGRKVIVRPIQPSDYRRCMAAREARLPQRNRFDGEIPAIGKMTPMAFKKRCQHYRETWKGQDHFVFAVFEISSGDYVGQVDIFTLNKQLRWGNLGYAILNNHWSKGYATEAAKIAVQISFQVLGFHRLEAGMEIGNKASARVAKKTGFKFEGRRLKFFPQHGGVDIDIYGANGIDFSAIRRRRLRSRLA